MVIISIVAAVAMVIGAMSVGSLVRKRLPFISSNPTSAVPDPVRNGRPTAEHSTKETGIVAGAQTSPAGSSATRRLGSSQTVAPADTSASVPAAPASPPPAEISLPLPAQPPKVIGDITPVPAAPQLITPSSQQLSDSLAGGLHLPNLGRGLNLHIGI